MLRGTLGSSLRSPAEGEGHEGFPHHLRLLVVPFTPCLSPGAPRSADRNGHLGLCAGKAGNPFQATQGNRLSCRDQEGRRGSDEVVP